MAGVELDHVRQRIEANEERLSPHAARWRTSKGRKRTESPSPMRGEYQRDRDRILHTKAFRRLKHKTQVFIAPQQDHFVTRMTHTLEVAQVARTIARALNLNEDLVEAAALGHDIGHGPFGHAGEEALAECSPDGFRHNLQSVRVLDVLESDGQGLNLTFEVLDAIEKSSKVRGDIFAEAWGVPETVEGQVVKTADAIAYVNHDILDAIRAGVITVQDLPRAVLHELGETHGERLDTMISDLVTSSWDVTGEIQAATPSGIRFSPRVNELANELRDFMFDRVYLHGETRREAERGKVIVKYLFHYFLHHPGQISSGFAIEGDPPGLRAADFVSGMTDRYALRLAGDLGCDEARDWKGWPPLR
ncbi:MAG: deoxyguanosinetriphosphate triphosphohydrolase [Dehalococcoidia bacterium]|nr:deoxyguanosinetriphosphate triphosphohydrolase [Dehalococcoidia bacterium]